MLEAVIFDWDGVIVDSREPHKRSWELLAEEEGLHLPENHMELGFGRRNQVIIPEILGWSCDPLTIQRLADRKEQLYREVIRREGIEALPGVRRLLDELRAAGVPGAIGSSTPKGNLDAALEVLKLAPYFAAMSSGDDPGASKPAPDTFLLAARRLGIEPRNCVVLEDAPVGIQAALAANMKAVAVLTSHPAENLRGAHRIVRDLTELSLADLRGLWD